jgi:preprotein translocase SecE subunit
MKSFVQYLYEVRSELSKVEWPKMNEFISTTIVVLVFITLSALFFGFVDRVIALILKHIFTYSI